MWPSAGRQSDNLTDTSPKGVAPEGFLWKAEGSPKSKEPWHWNEVPIAKQFLEFVKETLNLRLSEGMLTAKGRYGGTYAHRAKPVRSA